MIKSNWKKLSIMIHSIFMVLQTMSLLSLPQLNTIQSFRTLSIIDKSDWLCGALLPRVFINEVTYMGGNKIQVFLQCKMPRIENVKFDIF